MLSPPVSSSPLPTIIGSAAPAGKVIEKLSASPPRAPIARLTRMLAPPWLVDTAEDAVRTTPAALQRRRPLVEVGRRLERCPDREQRRFSERLPDDLHPHRQTVLVEATGDVERRQPGEAGNAGELHDRRQHVLFHVVLDHHLHRSNRRGSEWQRGTDEHIDGLERVQELAPQQTAIAL